MSPTQSFPVSNVLYRIQSVDSAQYLELYDVSDEVVVMRPFKDCLEQQWIFVPSGTNDDTYKILNSATKFLRNPRSLTNNPFDTDAGATAVIEGAWAGWAVKEADRKDVFSITTCKGTQRNCEIFLLVDENGKTGFVEEKISNVNTFSQNKKWRVLEVSPSVPKDTYRIRTLNGTALHMKPDSGVVSVKNIEKGKHQEWEVEPLGNGRCTIKSASEIAYLGWELSMDGFPNVVKTTSPHVWNVGSLGEYTCLVSMKYTLPDQTSIMLALSSGNKNEIKLKPKKVAHNQIWLFETLDAWTSVDDTPVNNLPPDETNRRFSEITDGGYYLRNIGTGQYVYVTGSPYRFTPNGSKSYAFNLKYIDTTDKFTLTYSTNIYFDCLGGLLVASNDTTSKWVLERDTDPAGGYCYSICSANDPELVVCGDTKKDINSYDLFTLVKKQNGYTRQQWKFEK